VAVPSPYDPSIPCSNTSPPPLCVSQEPHRHQVEFLASHLTDYSWVGEGRNPVIFGLGEEVSIGVQGS